MLSTRFEIVLVSADPPSGRIGVVSAPDIAPIEFVGWLDLLAALDGLVDAIGPHDP